MALVAREHKQSALLWERLGKTHAKSKHRHSKHPRQYPERCVEGATKRTVAATRIRR